MKHANAATLLRIEDLIEALRALGLLREPRPGCFYRKASAFLHFHEDAAGIFADVKLDPPGFSRLPANTAAQRVRVLQLVKAALATAPPRR